MVINIHDVWVHAKTEHHQYLDNRIQRHKPTILPPTAAQQHAFDFIERQKSAIYSIGEIDPICAIEDFKNEIERKLPIETTNEILKIFKKIFNYSSFSDKKRLKDGKWCAYTACSRIKYDYCPYCQINSIETYISADESNGDKSYRPDLDHYYDVASHPFLAITLGNLVPCCHVCNGPQGKHSNNFYTNEHLNPFTSPENISFKLEHITGSIINLRSPHKSFSVKIYNNGCTKAQRSITTFRLEEKYNKQTQEAYYTERRLHEAKTRLEIVKHELPFLNKSIEYALGFYPGGDSYKYTAIGKLKMDILHDFLSKT